MAFLFQRRSVIVPTLYGWTAILLLGIAPVLFWWFRGETLLSITKRLPADVLIVEAWTGPEGGRAAGLEFNLPDSHYRHVLVVGGLTGDRWTRKRWSLVDMALLELKECGVPSDKLIPIMVEDSEKQRTFEIAVAAKRALQERGIKPTSVNVLTRGSHARRSQMVFAKVFGEEAEVGIISWAPEGSHQGPWWLSSRRAEELIKETVGFLFEALLNSGRASNEISESDQEVSSADLLRNERLRPPRGALGRQHLLC